MTTQTFVSDYLMHPAIGLTLRVTLLALLMQILAGLPLGLYLAGKKNPLKSVVELIVTLPMIFPPMALGFFLLLVYRPFYRDPVRFQDNLYLLGGADCCFYRWFAVYG